MGLYKVNADFTVNVLAEVEADSAADAEEKAKAAILSKDCEFQDPVCDPKINWVEADEDEEDRQCFYCGQESCDCDML